MPQVDDAWPAYYDALAGREPRPLVARAMTVTGPPAADDHAVDLGCGDGTEAAALAAAGWRVLAVDGSADGVRRTRALLEALVAEGRVEAHRVEARRAELSAVDLPACRLVLSCFALPFAEDLAAAWAGARGALVPGGVLAVTIFGDRDDWTGEPGVSTVTRTRLEEMLDGLDVLELDEAEEDRPTALGVAKHWHTYEVLALRPPR